MKPEKKEIRSIRRADARRRRRPMLLLSLLALLIFLFCISFRYNAAFYEVKFVPSLYFKCFKKALSIGLGRLTGSMETWQMEDEIAAVGEVAFYGALAQLKMILMAFVAGGGLALAGAVFQTIYKNPMASPSMLGATVGVNLGNVIMVTLYSSAALRFITLRYRYCYALSALCVAGVLLLGMAAGRRGRARESVLEIVLSGSILSQGMNVITQYYMYRLEDEDLLVYQELMMGTDIRMDAVSLTLFFTVMLGSILPLVLLRYRMNAVGIDAEESRAAGVNPTPLVILGQVCGVLLTTASMIHCGQIGMVTMVVPYLIRMRSGSDFRTLCIESLLVGGSLLMVCRLLSSFYLVEGEPLPVTFLVNIALLPVFMVMLAKDGNGSLRE